MFSFVDMQQQKDERLSPQDRSRKVEDVKVKTGFRSTGPSSGCPGCRQVSAKMVRSLEDEVDPGRLLFDFNVPTLYLYPRSITLELITLASMATHIWICQI